MKVTDNVVMKTLVLLMILVSCGKDPVSNNSRTMTQSEKDMFAPTDITTACKKVSGCLTFCEQELGSCLSMCGSSSSPVDDRCRQDCRSNKGACEWATCENACMEDSFYPYHRFTTKELCQRLNCPMVSP